MQAAHPILKIDIIGINEVGRDSANDLMVDGKELPWLQDVDVDGNELSDVWTESWDVTYRDVVLLDGNNSVVDVYNLTENNLAEADDYAALRTKLIDAAMAEQKPWQNPTNRFDVNNDGHVVPLDVLLQINSIETDGSRKLPPPTGTELEAPFYDCDGDGWLAPIDVLLAVNYIEDNNGESAEGEGSLTEYEESALVMIPPVTDSASATEMALANPAQANWPDWSAADSVLPDASIVPSQAVSTGPSVAASPALDPEDVFWASYWGASESDPLGI